MALASLPSDQGLGEGTLREQRSQAFLYSALLVVSVVVTTATSVLLWAHVVYPSPEVWNYGLPFSFRQISIYPFETVSTFYNGVPFLADVLFYTAIGYLAIVPYQLWHRNAGIVSRGVVLSVAYVLLVVSVSILLHMTYCGMYSRQCG